ncbi:MAG: RlmF-related methyltransferase [Candidatus Protochlamydia sp.]|nr:RlmF-related methyltransferase [Candidatus Protochlamydia sp.]
MLNALQRGSEYFLYKKLEKVRALEVKTINMSQGQKKSRIVAWIFI